MTPSIVLCESYDSLREGLELALGERYQVRSTNRLDRVSGLLIKDIPSLLILDVDGQVEPYEAVKRIRQEYPDLRILLLAGEFALERQVELVKLTGFSFMEKSFRLEPLLEKIDTLIHGYSKSPIRTRVVRIALGVKPPTVHDGGTAPPPQDKRAS